MAFAVFEAARCEANFHHFSKAFTGAGLTELTLVGVERNVTHSLVVWISGGHFSEAIVVLCMSHACGERKATRGHSQSFADFSVARSCLNSGIGIVNDNTLPCFQSSLTFSHTLLPSPQRVTVHMHVTLGLHVDCEEGCLARSRVALKDHNLLGVRTELGVLGLENGSTSQAIESSGIKVTPGELCGLLAALKILIRCVKVEVEVSCKFSIGTGEILLGT